MIEKNTNPKKLRPIKYDSIVLFGMDDGKPPPNKKIPPKMIPKKVRANVNKIWIALNRDIFIDSIYYSSSNF
ncbi:MAG: hypothetical protein UU53_C0015G0001 [Candidatus Curtissbacteria bacterium GW2011_GWC2_41_21]|nr:MAG: hypothetical protein UU53_C0015G0001 [Candidatus Curtissbacteria bacterium GW2011_GWC2_41_21]